MRKYNKKFKCVDCQRRIINPVCTDCRLKQINAWLDDQKTIPSEKKLILLKNLETLIPKKTENNISCIYCKKNNVSICTYCYFSHFEKLLNKFDIPAPNIDSFQQIFNYRLYSKEL